MCITSEPSRMSKTIVYAGDTTIDGQYRHVLGYQNRAENLFDGPNAMLLPFPAEGRMGPDNAINVASCRNILSDMGALFEDHSRGVRAKGLRLLGTDDYLEVFDTGDYTVVLASDARAIPDALHLVPEHKRPRVNTALFDAYAKWYPTWPIALCCFEAKKAVENQPLLWWYLPKANQHDKFFLPAVDGHDGGVPNFRSSATVQRDHTLIVGTTRRNSKRAGSADEGWRVNYQDTLPAEVQQYLPTHILGTKLGSRTTNGDFTFVAREAHSPVTARAAFALSTPPGANS